MRKAIHAGHVSKWHVDKLGFIDYLVDGGYILVFAIMLGLMFLPYLSRFF